MRIFLLAVCLASLVSVHAIFEDTIKLLAEGRTKTVPETTTGRRPEEVDGGSSSAPNPYDESKKKFDEDKKELEAEIRKQVEEEYRNRTAKWHTTPAVPSIQETTTSSTSLSPYEERKKKFEEEWEKLTAEIRKQVEEEYRNRMAKWHTTPHAPVVQETTTSSSATMTTMLPEPSTTPSEIMSATSPTATATTNSAESTTITQETTTATSTTTTTTMNSAERAALRAELIERWKDMQLGETEIEDMIDDIIENEMKNLIEAHEVTKANSTNSAGCTGNPKTCTDPVGKGREFIIIVDRSYLSNKEKFISLTDGLIDLINPWETNNRLSIITYAADATIDVELNGTDSKEEILEKLQGKSFAGPGDLMLAMRTANEQVLDPLPWHEHYDKEKVVIILMADSASVGSRENGERCHENDDFFKDCIQRGYAHQSALMTGKYQAKIFLVTVGVQLLNNLKYVTPLQEIVHMENFDNFSLHPLDEFTRRFCSCPSIMKDTKIAIGVNKAT